MLQNLAHDLRTSLLSSYPSILSAVLNILPANNSRLPAVGPSTPRKLSPSTLTALIMTLSALFRYILLPSPQLLKPSWITLRQAMLGIVKKRGSGVSGEEMERMLAEVWGVLLRRIRKAEMREEAVALLVEGLEGCEEGVAWIFIYALQVYLSFLGPKDARRLTV